jgi:hypothetical protein
LIPNLCDLSSISAGKADDKELVWQKDDQKFGFVLAKDVQNLRSAGKKLVQKTVSEVAEEVSHAQPRPQSPTPCSHWRHGKTSMTPFFDVET